MGCYHQKNHGEAEGDIPYDAPMRVMAAGTSPGIDREISEREDRHHELKINISPIQLLWTTSNQQPQQSQKELNTTQIPSKIVCNAN